MILEHVLIKLRPGQTAAYLTAFEQAKQILARQPGFHSSQLLPALDQTDSFLLLINWEKQSDHTEGFRKSVDYQEWSQLLHHFYAPFPRVQYFQL